MRGKMWICPFCLTRNPLPASYKDISPSSLPQELLPQYSTVEYILGRPAQVPPIFLFVVDTCQDEDNLHALKEAIILSLNLIPQNALVGLLSFGTMTQVHELGYTECHKSYVFRGQKEYSSKQIQEMLGLLNVGARSTIGRGPQPNVGASAR